MYTLIILILILFISSKNIEKVNSSYLNSSLELKQSDSNYQLLNPISIQTITEKGINEIISFTFKSINNENIKKGIYNLRENAEMISINVDFEKRDNGKIIENDATYIINNNQIIFKFNLFKNQELKVTLNIQYKEKYNILYREEHIFVQEFFKGKCQFYFISDFKFKNLGLQYDSFIKINETTFKYDNDCPSTIIDDYLRLTPKKILWNTYFEISFIPKSNINLIIPKYYFGGPNNDFTEYLAYTSIPHFDVEKESSDSHFIINYIPNRKKKFDFKLNSIFSIYSSNNWNEMDLKKYVTIHQRKSQLI